MAARSKPAALTAFAAEYRARGEKLLAHALPLADECYAEIVKLIDG